MTAAIDITESQRKTLLAILRRHIPGSLVWAYGSRVKFTARPNSDLDLVVFTSPAQKRAVSDLKDDLAESTLPFIVDVHVWDEVPEKFHDIIRKEYVVIQGVEEKGEVENTVRLRDACVKIGSGATPRGGKEAYKGGDISLIRSQNIYNEGFHRDGLVYISDDQAAELRNVEVMENDVLLNITGDSVARCCQVAADVLPARVNQHVAIIRPDPKALDARFLRYVLVSHEYQSLLLALASAGATRPALTKSMIDELEVPLPPLAEQRAIAAVLGALDDKIELNRRMNATLEAMARALFQSWFVDFDPVRAKLDGRQPVGLDPATAALFPDSFEDSDLGHIPKGWEVGRLGQYLATEIGGDWGEDDRFDGAIEVAALRGVDLEHLRERGDANPPRRWIKESSLTKRRMSACDVLVASSGAGPCGRPLWVSPHLEAAFPVPVLYSNFCKRYRAATPAHALYFDRVLFEMRASGEIWDFINGTSLPNLDSNGLMTGKSVLVPPVNILAKFAAFVQPIYEGLYSRESRTLATLRDTLLPKLLSGELSVDQLQN